MSGFWLLPGCEQAMRDQLKHKPLSPSTFFDDGQSARPLVPDTIARGQLRTDEHLYRGKVGRDLVTTFPFPVDHAVLRRGQERYAIYCTPCHDAAGTGNGMVVRRGYRRPPSYHIDRLREAPVGHFYDVVTNGFGAMPSYAAQVPPRDRWAIVAYVRALQLSQNATIEDVPEAERDLLDRQP